jgi:hypothetical protein
MARKDLLSELHLNEHSFHKFCKNAKGKVPGKKLVESTWFEFIIARFQSLIQSAMILAVKWNVGPHRLCYSHA